MRYIYTVPEELTAPKIAFAMQLAMPDARMVMKYHAGDWYGFGSPVTIPHLLRARDEGYNFWYCDKGYFGRGHYYRITKNRWQHTGEGKPNYNRLAKFISSPKRWVHGRKIILALQSEYFFSTRGIDRKVWVDSILSRLGDLTDRPIVITDKRKPSASYHHNAHALITYSSNAAIDALFAGVPVFCEEESPAHRFSMPLEYIENPCYPSHDELMHWGAVLANNQWNMHEIAKGKWYV